MDSWGKVDPPTWVITLEVTDDAATGNQPSAVALTIVDDETRDTDKFLLHCGREPKLKPGYRSWVNSGIVCGPFNTT